MRTSTTYKLQVISAAIKADMHAGVLIRGMTEFVTVQSFINRHHSVELTLISRSGGILIIDPDDIVAVKVFKMPSTGVN